MPKVHLPYYGEFEYSLQSVLIEDLASVPKAIREAEEGGSVLIVTRWGAIRDERIALYAAIKGLEFKGKRFKLASSAALALLAGTTQISEALKRLGLTEPGKAQAFVLGDFKLPRRRIEDPPMGGVDILEELERIALVAATLYRGDSHGRRHRFSE